jgi:hypothetical protein
MYFLLNKVSWYNRKFADSFYGPGFPMFKLVTFSFLRHTFAWDHRVSQSANELILSCALLLLMYAVRLYSRASEVEAMEVGSY